MHSHFASEFSTAISRSQGGEDVFNGVEDIRLRANYIVDAENICIMKYLTSKTECVHMHDFVEIEYVYAGSGVQVINGKQYPVSHGSMIFLNIGEYHSYHTEGKMGIVDCLINPCFIHESLNSGNAPVPLEALDDFRDFDLSKPVANIKNFTGRDMLKLDSVFDAMYEEFQEKSAGYLRVLKHYISILLAFYFRAENQSDHLEANRLDVHMPQIFEYIRKNYYRKISLNELASMCFYSPAYFSTLFRERMGKTISEYICEFRIAEAARLLKETDQRIEDICHRVGYADKKSFYGHFKHILGVTPNSYRAMAKREG